MWKYYWFSRPGLDRIIHFNNGEMQPWSFLGDFCQISIFSNPSITWSKLIKTTPNAIVNSLPDRLPEYIFILEIGAVLLEICEHQSEWAPKFPTCILFARQCMIIVSLLRCAIERWALNTPLFSSCDLISSTPRKWFQILAPLEVQPDTKKSGQRGAGTRTR